MFQGLVKFFKKIVRGLGPIIVAAIFITAVYLLYREIRKYSFDELYMSVYRIPNWNLFMSVFFAIINYIILIGYDWLAIRGIHKNLPIHKVSLVSFVGQAVSYNFGALLGGSTVRYRFYRSWGFSSIDIVKLILMLAITFWVGALGLAGAIFLFIPPEIPPDLAHYFPMQDIRPLGALLLVIAISYLLVCKFVHKPIHIGGKEFSFPPFHIAVTQAIVASADLVAACGCLYVLLPESANISFIQFLPMYLMAMVAVVLTHVPGGAGVLEITILHLTSASTQDVLAALLCFRVIYYLIPLLIAVIIFIIYEVHKQTEENIHLWKKVFRYLKVYAPVIVYFCVFVIGSIFITIVMLPIGKEHLEVLQKIFPHWVIDISSIITGVSGIFLLFLSVGVKNRKQRAFYLSIICIFAGCIGIALSMLNFIISVSIVCISLLFLYVRHSFYRKTSLWNGDFSIRWFTTALSICICSAILGLSIRHVDIGNIFWITYEHVQSSHRIIRVILCEAFVIAFLIVRYIEITSICMIKRKKHSCID